MGVKGAKGTETLNELAGIFLAAPLQCLWNNFPPSMLQRLFPGLNQDHGLLQNQWIRGGALLVPQDLACCRSCFQDNFVLLLFNVSLRGLGIRGTKRRAIREVAAEGEVFTRVAAIL